MSDYTTKGITETVPVREFRNRISHLERKVRVDLSATANHSELMRWVEECRRVAQEVIRTGCKRAKPADWDRRERALDWSADAIGKVMVGEITRRPCPPRLTVVR